MDEDVEVPNFSFVIPGKLAGSGNLGNFRKPLSVDLELLKKQGIVGIVSLTEWSLNKTNEITDFGFEYLHLPIQDFGIPSYEQIEEFTKFVDNVTEAKQGGVLAHCFAGVGRTGTMISLYLVTKGATPDDALKMIREKRPGSVETKRQERLVREYAEHLASKLQEQAL